MDRKKKAQAVFAKLQSKKPNQTCVDCDAYNPQWASVNCACFFCIKCAGTHRSLGVHLSFVRSVGMDEWNDRQLACMKVGGNAQLRKFWSDQGFPSSISSQDKYDNEAMEAYRAYIKAKARGENVSLPGHIGFQKRIRKKKTKYQGRGISSAGQGYQPQSRRTDDDPWASFTSSLGSITSQIGSSVNSGISKMQQHSQQIDTDQLTDSVKTGWSSLTSWVSDTASKAAANIKDLQTDQSDDFTSKLRNNLGPSTRKMKGMGSSPTSHSRSSNSQPNAGLDDLFPRRNIGTGKKMAGLSSDSYFNDDDSSNRRSSASSRPKKKYGGLSSEDYFSQEDKGRQSNTSSRSKKKYGGLSSEDYFSQEDKGRQSNKSSRPKKKYGGLSSEDYFSNEKKAKPESKSRAIKAVVEEEEEDDVDLDDFGFSDDEIDDTPATKSKVVGKIAKVEDDDDEDVDFDNWGLDDDATKV